MTAKVTTWTQEGCMDLLLVKRMDFEKFKWLVCSVEDRIHRTRTKREAMCWLKERGYKLQKKEK